MVWFKNLNVSVCFKVTNFPMPLTMKEQMKLYIYNAQSQLQIILSLLVSFAFLVGSFVVLTVKERTLGAKHLQVLTGVKRPIYWLAYFIIDFCLYLLSSALIIGILVWHQEDTLYTDGQPLYTAVIFAAQGLAALPFVYCASFMFTFPATAYATLCLLMIVAGMGTILTDQITKLQALHLEGINDLVNPIFALILPLFSMGKAMNNLMDNYTNRNICHRDYVVGNVSHNIQDLCRSGGNISEQILHCCECKSFLMVSR